MDNILSFDEAEKLNNDRTDRTPLPIEQYFGEMELPESDIKDRIALAKKMQDVVYVLFSIYALHKAGLVTERYVAKQVANEYLKTVADYVVVDNYITSYVNKVCKDIVKTTIQHEGDSYYLSSDRAIFIAENESNAVLNYQDLQDAIRMGKKNKQWLTIMDNKARPTHNEADGIVIPINDYFKIGTSELLFPKDTSRNPSAAEIVNCRCSVKYF